MTTAAERIAARQRGSSTAASRIASRASSGGTTAAERYQHPTGGARGTTFLEEQAPKVKPTGVWSPIQAGFDYLSRPAFAIGNLAARRPVEAGKNILNLVAPPSAAVPGLSGKKTYVSEVAREKGWLPGGKLGIALGLGLDIATDPVTYASFGVGGAVKAGATSPAKLASLRIAQVAEQEGRRLLPKEIAEIAAEGARAEAALPREFTVGVRLPFTRGKTKTIARSTKIPAAIGRAVDKIPGTEKVAFGLSKGITPRRGVIPEVDDTYQWARRSAETWARDYSRQASKLDADIRKAEKSLPGFKPGQGAELIAKHLDNPAAYPDLPEALRPHAETAARILREIDDFEDVAGIAKGKVENYVPHFPARPQDQEMFRNAFAQPSANNLDDPFFVKPRVTDNLDEFEAAGERFGFKPELNIARIIEARARASFTAQTKKAVDDAIFAGYVPKDPEEARTAWRTITSAEKYHKGKALPDDVAASLALLHKNITRSVQTEDGLAAIGRFAANIGGRWKGLALLSPGFHVRSMIDDGVRTYWAGARNPHTFDQAFRLITGKGARSVKVRGKAYSPEEIINLAESAGVIRTGFVRSEIASSADTVRRTRIQGPGRGPLVRASGELGQVRDDTTRLFLFLERLKAGDDLVTAANVTRDALFDYGQVGKFVEMARKFWVPFITFPSKAIPHTARIAAAKPGLLANTAKGIETSNLLAGDPDLSVLPPWTPSAFAVPTNPAFRRLVGAPEDQQLVLDPERVTGWASINMLDPRRGELRQNLSGMLNPLATTPAEMLTKYDLFFGRSRAKLAKQPALIQALGQLGIPIPGAGEKKDAISGALTPGYSPDLDAILSLLPVYGQASYAIPRQGSESPRLGPVKFLTGFPLSPYDRARQAALAERYSK